MSLSTELFLEIEEAVIENENENPSKAIVLSLDNHSKHIRSHLRHMWKPRIFFHIVKHVYIDNTVSKLFWKAILNK